MIVETRSFAYYFIDNTQNLGVAVTQSDDSGRISMGLKSKTEVYPRMK